MQWNRSNPRNGSACIRASSEALPRVHSSNMSDLAHRPPAHGAHLETTSIGVLDEHPMARVSDLRTDSEDQSTRPGISVAKPCASIPTTTGSGIGGDHETQC